MEYNAFRSLLDGLAEQWNDAFRSLGIQTPDGRKIPYLQDCIKDFQAHPDRAVTFMRSNYNETIHVE